MCDVVISRAYDACDVKSLDIVFAESSVLIDNVECGSAVVLSEHSDVQYLLADIFFLLYLSHGVSSVFSYDEYVVYCRTIAHIFAPFELVAHKSVGIVATKLFVGYRNSGFFYHVKVAYLGFSCPIFAIFVFNSLKVCNGIVNQVVQVFLYGGNVVFDCNQSVVGSVAVVFGYAVYWYFSKAMNIVYGNFSYQVFDKGLQAFHYCIVNRLIGSTFFHFLIYALLDEDSLQRNPIPLFV